MTVFDTSMISSRAIIEVNASPPTTTVRTTSDANTLCSSSSNSSPLPRRPKRPLRAYQYFFNDEVRKLSRGTGRSASCATSNSSDFSGPAVVLASPAAKRRRSDFGATLVSDDEHEHSNDADSSGLKDVGKIIGEKWRALSELERSMYEDRAAEDADRYEREIEHYYKKLSDREVERWRALASGHASSPNLVGIDSDGSGSGAPSTQRLLCASKADRRSSDSDAIVTQTPRAVSKAYYISGGDSKAGLRALLADRRKEVLSDVATLNEIAAARGRGEGSASGGVRLGRQHSLYQQTRTDAGAMQRMFNVAVGPGGGSSKRSSYASTISSTSSRSIMDAVASSSFSDLFSDNDRLENTTFNFSSSGSDSKKTTAASCSGVEPEPHTRPALTGSTHSLKNTSFSFSSSGTKTATSGFKFVRPPTTTATNSGGGLNRLKNTSFSFTSGASSKATATLGFKPTRPPTTTTTNSGGGGGGGGGLDRLKNTTFSFSSTKGTSGKSAGGLGNVPFSFSSTNSSKKDSS